MPQGAGTVIEVTIPVGAGRNVSVQYHLTDFHLFTELPDTIQCSSEHGPCPLMGAKSLHRLHDFWSRSATDACTETISGSLNLSSYFI